MIDQRCLGPDVDRSKISPDAEITGASYLTGHQTGVAPGAVVRDSRLHDTIVRSGARIVDSISIAHGKPKTHDCDTAGRVVVRSAVPTVIHAGAGIISSTLTNTSIGRQTLVVDSSIADCRIGAKNQIRTAKLVLTETLDQVTITGPTEVSEAHLGHHAMIDRRGYFEGIFSNQFLRLQFNEAWRCLQVVGTIDLPHVSRYGTNTINSTNSGKLLPQPDGIVHGLGPRGGLCADPLLSHEQVELGPCCWVAPWTKVVGQSSEPHADDEALVNDRLTTYLMPFSIAGVGGELTRGLVMPGELSVGLGPKQRRGAWTFTYAPGAVIAMVARLHAALPEAQKPVADTIVDEALRTAIEMTRAMAAEYDVDLGLPLGQQKPGGWPRWIALTHALLRAHLDNGLWRFYRGRPCEWYRQDNRWTNPHLKAVLALAPDALERQVDESAIFEFDDPVGPLEVAVSGESLDELLGAGQGGPAVTGDLGSRIAPEARIAPSATIGPGCRIGPGAIVEGNTEIWRSALDDCHIEAGSIIQRSVIRDSRIAAGSTIRSSRMVDSRIGHDSTAEAASIERSRLAARATVSPFASLEDVQTDFGVILGGRCRSARIHTNLMSMHLAGQIAHLEALPTTVVLDGRPVDVPAVPMIGGGAILRGTDEAPVRVECSFIGSNAIIEAGVRLGFGCFVLGRLAPLSGLPPLTVATDEDPRRHQIGGVLGSLPSTIITHFLGWAYQAVEPELVPAVAELVRQSIERGIEAVEAELARRKKVCRGCLGHSEAVAQNAQAAASDNVLASLADYTEKQLHAGLANYRRSLASGAWELVFREGQLRFVGEKGKWLERSGTALWINR